MIAITRPRPRRGWHVALVAAGLALVVRGEHGPPAQRAIVEVEVDDPTRIAALASALDVDGDRIAPLFTRDAPELRRWIRIDTTDADAALRALRAMPGVIHAERAPQVTDAYFDAGTGVDAALDAGPTCPIKTPSFTARQGYAAPAPDGIDAAAAWAVPGGRGQGVRLADVESAWNPDHEDLPADRIEKITRGRRGAYGEHGTAVLGELIGVDNNLGVTGLVPGVERTFTASYLDTNLADAIDRAAARLRAGDVLLLEVQGTGPRDRFIPVEYWASVFDVIQRATARGVIVVEAAGNGGEDLDHPAYRGAFDRARRDSGAILVGAGGPSGRDGFVARARLDFSNYGARVDVQGWGRMVATLDYGDLQRCGAAATPDRRRDYTDRFAGTSSASPIVAAAAVQLAGVYRARHGAPIAPRRLRALLTSTGSPQVDGPAGPAGQHIGPLPDVRAALAALD